jgi:hypothetical protein
MSRSASLVATAPAVRQDDDASEFDFLASMNNATRQPPGLSWLHLATVLLLAVCLPVFVVAALVCLPVALAVGATDGLRDALTRSPALLRALLT